MYRARNRCCTENILWLFSVERKKATFGQQLLCLKYQNNIPLSKLRLLGALMIGFSYLKGRSSNFERLKNKVPNWVSFVLTHFEFAISALNVLSFLVFLRRGGSPLFVENVFGIKPVSTVKPSERSIGYSYMTRELLWHGAIELFCLVLPHINVPKLGRIARNAVFGKPAVAPAARPPVFSSQAKCSICRQYPIVPHVIGCDHFFCYFCISSSLLADRKYECPDCGYCNPDGMAVRWVVK
uniref:RING-type E3 ubiquitin transferase (cysteine targeting) n=1 Tax=Lygus hesperus TaxID=30085 RepID=A0A0K8SAR3_LYGHE